MPYVVTKTTWEQNKVLDPHQFEIFPPTYQAECLWCRTLSDPLDTKAEQKAWVKDHECIIYEIVKTKEKT